MSGSEYFSNTTDPATRSSGSSSVIRAVFASITTAFGKCPDLSGNGGKAIFINSGATAMEAVTTTGTGNGVRATSPTFTTPVLGVATATTINKVTFTTPATGSTLTITDGKTFAVSNTLTFTGTDASSVAFGAGGTVAYTALKLSGFAATTSAELAGVISDETGSGSLVFGTSPTIASPTLSGTITQSASATTLSANHTATRAMGAAASGASVAVTELTTFSGDAGGTTDVRSFQQKTTVSGTNNVAQANVRSTQLELTHSTGTVTFAYADQAFIRLGLAGSTTGNVTSARGYEFHFANEGTGVISSAINFYAQDVDLLDGTGNITDIYGFKSGDLGHATRVPGLAIGFDAGDMTAGAATTAAYRSQMASGTNKWGAYFSGSANNAFVGNVRIGSTVAPTVALNVTGEANISSTLTVPSGVITTGNTTNLSFRTSAGEQMKIINVASAVNVVQVEGGATGNSAVVRSVGEANASIHLHSSGTGSTLLGTNGGVAQVEIINTSTVTRRLTLTGSNGGNPTIATTAGDIGITPAVIGAASITAHAATAIPAGGTAGAGLLVSSTANFGIFFGSGAPTLAAAKGSLYLRSDGSSSSTRMYVNSDGSTAWVAVTTAS